MIHITDNEGAAQAKYQIEMALLKGASWQLADGRSLLVALERGSYEFNVEWGKLIFAWWDDERSQSWNVTDYEIGAVELRLRAVRGLGRETAVFTLRDPARQRMRQQLDALPTAQRRSNYAAALTNLITGQIVSARVLRVNVRGGRASSSAGPYARLVLNVGGEVVLALGVDAGEAQAEIDSVVTAGLTWLAGFNQRRTGKQQAQQLWFCVPRGRSQTVVERLTFIDVTHLVARAACFEVDEDCEELIAVRPATQGELLNAHPRELRWPREMAVAGRWRERILNLAPDLIEARELVNRDAESYAIHGLEFARASGHERARVSFGVMNSEPENQRRLMGAHGKHREHHLPTILTEANFSELEGLVREIARHRCANPDDRRHPFYRLRAEAWLESLLRRNISALDLTLDERFVYSQIPTWRADERSVIDLLTVNHEGRLVVIEIKAAEDPDLPLQGLDYWLRVEQARGRGEFEQRGLFPGLTLDAEPPLLYLAAPRLRFHRTFSTVAHCLAPQVEAYRLGLNADWRGGVRLHTRERVN